jgi:hypothetical protein
MATKNVSLNKGEGTPVWVLVQPWLATFYTGLPSPSWVKASHLCLYVNPGNVEFWLQETPELIQGWLTYSQIWLSPLMHNGETHLLHKFEERNKWWYTVISMFSFGWKVTKISLVFLFLGQPFIHLKIKGEKWTGSSIRATYGSFCHSFSHLQDEIAKA